MDGWMDGWMDAWMDSFLYCLCTECNEIFYLAYSRALPFELMPCCVTLLQHSRYLSFFLSFFLSLCPLSLSLSMHLVRLVTSVRESASRSLRWWCSAVCLCACVCVCGLAMYYKERVCVCVCVL